MTLKTVKLGLALVAGLLFAATTANAADGVHHCINNGGVVQTRVPTYGTNGGDPLTLSGSANFCRFTSQKDGSHIDVLLSTLETKQPTLAALAYYAQVPMGSCNGNPGSCYCSLVGGTDLFGGINAAGGGWVLNTDPTDVLEMCVFPDMSAIDSWGLAYHSAGIVRGKNLAKALHYNNPYDTAKAPKKGAPKSLPFLGARTARRI